MDTTVLDASLVADTLRRLITPDAALVDETITHSRVIAEHLQAGSPGRYTYVQGGLGQGIGVALGIKYAERGTEVVLTIGDGSFLYNPIVQSLAASRDLDLPLLIVVFNNHRYLSMQMNHLRFYPEGTAVQDENFRGVDLATQPDLAAFAAPFDMVGLTVREAADLEASLTRALTAVRAGTTAIVDVHVIR